MSTAALSLDGRLKCATLVSSSVRPRIAHPTFRFGARRQGQAVTSGSVVGIRDFTDQELGLAMDLPTSMLSDAVGLQKLVRDGVLSTLFPAKLSGTLLELVLQELPGSTTARDAFPSPPASAATFQEQPEWIRTQSGIVLFDVPLSPAWADHAHVSAMSTKSDDAEVPVHLWNNRILQFYPQARARHLDVLRRHLSTKWASLLCRSFRRFLVREYRSRWPLLLFLLRTAPTGVRGGGEG